jgi:hypothetical protein
MALIKTQNQVTKLYGEWHMENAPVRVVNTCEKTGFKVEVCTDSPKNPVLKHATVLRWNKQSKNDAPVNVIFLAEQIYAIVEKLNEKNLPYNFNIFNQMIIIIPRKH